VLRGGGPPPASDELEQHGRLAVELVVLWRGEVLSVCHRPAPGVIHVGRDRSCSDVALPAELFHSGSSRIAVASRSEVCVVLQAGVRCWLTLPDGSVGPLEAGATAEPGAPSPAERLVPIGAGLRAHLCFGEIEIQLAPVPAGRAPARPRALGFEPAALAYLALSALSVGGLLAALSLLAPPLGLSPDEHADAERRYVLQSYLQASDERALALRAEGLAPVPDTTPALLRASRGKAPPPYGTAEPEIMDIGQLLGPHGRRRGSAPRIRPLDTRPTASFRPGTAGPILGTLSTEAVQHAVNGELPKLRACRTLGAKRWGFEGVFVQFVVHSDGRVGQVSVGSQLPSSVRGCIERVFRGLRFEPPGTGPVPITYPLEIAR
jgi:hypothetical protein